MRRRTTTTSAHPRRTRIGRPRQWVLLVAAALALWTTTASAQLDPLLFLKRVAPNVLFVVDLGPGMLSDADGTYYDPNQYKWSNSGGDAAWQTALGLVSGVNITNGNNAPYYRKFVNRTYSSGVVSGQAYNFAADSISVVGNLDSGYSTFYEKTRFMVARRALVQAIDENSNVVRFGLLKTRQTSAAWGTPPSNKLANDAAKIANAGAGAAQQTNTDTGKTGVWYYMKATVSGNNGSAAASTAISNGWHADDSGVNTTVRTALDPSAGLTGGSLIPANNTTSTQTDRPLGLMVDDTKTEVTRLINADTVCRNTVVVMVVAGGEGTTVSGATGATTAAKASAFTSISSRRVPIHVIAIAPAAADVANLQLIATNSGGRYTEISKANIDAVTAGSAVPEFVAAVNTAIQGSFQRYAECNSGAAESEFQTTSPIVGTVNLEGALDINGSALTNTKVVDKEGNAISDQVMPIGLGKSGAGGPAARKRPRNRSR